MQVTFTPSPGRAMRLRAELVKVALEWEGHFGVSPSITTAISELDAALLVGMPEEEYCADRQLQTAVTRDVDFRHGGVRYQITANRPSGRPGSPVTLVSQKSELKRAFGWDRLIWLLYDRYFVLQEAWEFTAKEYHDLFNARRRLSPDDMRQGRCIFPSSISSAPPPTR